MHDDHHHPHDHDHDHHHGHGHHPGHGHHHGHDHDHAHPSRGPAGRGHNHRRDAAQWQTPHLPEDAGRPEAERDLDLVEVAFAEGFAAAKDPTSFLRLAHIPFVGVDANGRRLHLLRVLIENLTDVGAVMPLLGGEGMRYDPLPAELASRRRRLTFVYHDGTAVQMLEFAAARSLTDETGASRFDLAAPAQ